MTLFWISTLILVAIACVFIAIPLIQKKANNDTVLRDELNKAFYKDRLNELQEETAEGLVDNQQDLIADLKQSLLDDIPADKQATQQSQVSTLAVLVPSVLLVVLLSYGMYAKFGNYDKVEHWQKVSADLPLLTRKLMAPQGQGVELTDQEMEDLTLSLRTRLYYQPEDSTGWLLLGRIAMANRDMQTAIGAMKHAYALEPQDGDIQLGYAQALMLSDDEMDQTQARSILQRLAKRDYVDLRVYSLLAFDAFERADYPSAIEYWGLMQKMIGPNDSRYEMLTRSIDSAKRKMGEGVVEGKSVSVTISLADNVVLPQNAVLIVSVHSADGAPMPIAAARYPLSSFPRTVVLDDNNSMMQGRKLSDLSTLIVRVRIDTDGNVSTKDGDWFGESQPVNLGEPVEVVINKQY
ncbi:c-type cytochrome biogenesis protein CcmI [Vibrio fluvialis]|uniref:Cytochrome c heme lyase subunit CcmH n=1 Tax=Vibrio fluvialis PG41 TaxID=1336752 RepID=S7HYM0_VIBFL|nr:c-type cytochrome biogenesis protein CcmI [Vibrio fluvialis]EPP20909.1 Cytochrome c heme lyase subunit CcmH [Vibrio fluvialis PG41]MBL4304023.1 c-type cytochrome biogenesis protein CcmI [Vibrio fluvialis]MBY7802588.1 c-type cytochrome biogenesis protein CcmI [Vibrio fluvialis]MBY7846200.1 c-type cytochrome biogenesis protein CcmI [Vibrio fluvialis]MBY7861326.1 c-type cytochrome biogenesis protein CcmI [Vibrio fluvialis]